MPDNQTSPDHHTEFRNTGVAPVLLAFSGLLFSDLTSLRVFGAAFSGSFGVVLFVRGWYPRVFLTDAQDAMHWDSSNVLKRVKQTAKTKWSTWVWALLICLLVSTALSIARHRISGGRSTSPVLTLSAIRQVIDEEIGRWSSHHPSPAPAVPNERPQDENLQQQILEIRRRLNSIPPPSAAAAFSIKVEYEMSSFGAPGKFTGFFVGSKGAAGYVLSPVTHLVYVRITNLLPVQTMVERLQVSLDECSPDDRFDMTMGGDVFTALRRNVPGTPAIGRMLVFKGNGTGRSTVMADLEGADLSRAATLNLPMLDRFLDGHYLAPGESVGGWLLFGSRCMGAQDNFLVEDVAGRSFRYVDTGRNEMESGDLSNNKVMTIVQPIDLSGSTIRGINP